MYFLAEIVAKYRLPALIIASLLGIIYFFVKRFKYSFNNSRHSTSSVDYARAESDYYSPWYGIDPIAFEKIVGHALRFKGLSVTERGGLNPDGGIDLIAEEPNKSRLGIQCKKYWVERISVEQVRAFIGALKDAKINRGIFVTLHGFSDEACQTALRNGVETWNEQDLCRILDKHEPQWSDELRILLTSSAPRCPNCFGRTTLRRARRGRYSGLLFWACRRKRCRGTIRFGQEDARDRLLERL